MTERTPLERVVNSGAFEVDEHGRLVVDDERNVRYDTARLVLAVQKDPTLLDAIADVSSPEAAKEISALVAQVLEHNQGSWVSRWWRSGVAFVGAIGIAWAIWLAVDHWPVIYTLRVIWHFFRRVVL